MNNRKVVASRRIEENTVTVETSGPVFDNIDPSAEAVHLLDQIGSLSHKADSLLDTINTIPTQEISSIVQDDIPPLNEQASEAIETLAEPSVLFKIPQSPSKTPQGKSLQRRNREISERQITVIFSKKLKTAHVTVHIGYTNRSKEGAVIFARNDLSKQQVTHQLSQAPDLEVHVYPEKYTGADIITAKFMMYNKYRNAGWHMVGQIPKDPVLASLATSA